MQMRTPASRLDPNLRSRELRDFERTLRRKIVGQDKAVQAVAELYQVFRAGLSAPGRPVGNLLFLGPTGAGKTRVVEAAGLPLAKRIAFAVWSRPRVFDAVMRAAAVLQRPVRHGVSLRVPLPPPLRWRSLPAVAARRRGPELNRRSC